MFYIYLVNFDLTLQDTFDTYAEACEFGKNTGFEFVVRFVTTSQLIRGV